MLSLLQRRRQMMKAASGGGGPIMNPSFGYTEGYKLNRGTAKPYLVVASGFAVTDFIYLGTTGTFKWWAPQTAKDTGASGSVLGHALQYAAVDGNYTDWWNNKLDGAFHSFGLSANKCYVRFGFDPDTMADLYAWNTSTGEVYFAGINTPYYGKTNIND